MAEALRESLEVRLNLAVKGPVPEFATQRRGLDVKSKMQGGAKNPRTLKRIATELEKLQNKDPLPYAKVALKDKSELLLWTVTMTGPV